MIVQRYEYTEEELKLYHLCHTLGSFSTCKDKQVGAVIRTLNNRLTVGYNRVINCNMQCDKTCNVIHAEEMALMAPDEELTGATAYISLFPCLRCQTLIMLAGIKKVVVFGVQGLKQCKEYWREEGTIELLPDVPRLLLSYNGPRSQSQVIQGELAELITALSNYFAREDRPESKMAQLQEIGAEVIDVKLQLAVLAQIIGLEAQMPKEHDKWNKLIAKFEDKFFPNKDL